MEKLQLSLDKFLNKVYDMDIDSHMDRTNFTFDFVEIDVTDKELDEFRKELDDDYDLDNINLRDILQQVKQRTYRMNFIDSYYEKFKERLRDNIQYSFEEIVKILGGENLEHELDFRNAKLIPTISFSERTITFEGDIDLLEDIVVSCINGYGMFYYDSIEEFRYVCGDESQKERIESHLHWLGYFKDIWGVNVFDSGLDLSDIARYLCVTADDYNMQDVRQEIEFMESI